MAKISSYPTVAPQGSDILVGTDGSDSNATKNFTAQSVANLCQIGSLGTDPAQVTPTPVLSVYANGDPANILGEPAHWVEISIEGTTYKFPAYL
jgi:hypothetical protein